MAPPPLKRQKSTLRHTLSEFDHVPSTQALPLPKSSADQNVPQPKASADQNIPQHQKATFEVAKMFMEVIVFTKTPWPILPNDNHTMVGEAWKLAIEAQDAQRALAAASVGTPSVCPFPGGPSPKIGRQTRQAVCLELCLMLL